MSQIIYRQTHTYKYILEGSFELQVGIPVPCQGQGGYVEITEREVLRVEKGYRWDGPSGPSFDTLNFMRGSLVHDCLYQFMREGDLEQSWRKRADELLRDICIEDGMPRIRANYVYWALRVFGASSARPQDEWPIVTSPP